jgi:hypothetical protein
MANWRGELARLAFVVESRGDPEDTIGGKKLYETPAFREQ